MFLMDVARIQYADLINGRSWYPCWFLLVRGSEINGQAGSAITGRAGRERKEPVQLMVPNPPNWNFHCDGLWRELGQTETFRT
jgi:hypothetical protein